MEYVRSWLGVPLIVQGQLIGLLRLDHERPDFFTRDDTERALAFASQVAVAIVNARLHEAAQRAAARRSGSGWRASCTIRYRKRYTGLRSACSGSRSWGTSTRPCKQLDLILGLAKTGLLERAVLIFDAAGCVGQGKAVQPGP